MYQHLPKGSRARRHTNGLPDQKHQRRWLALGLLLLATACSTSESSSTPESSPVKGTDPAAAAPTKPGNDMSEMKHSPGNTKPGGTTNAVPPELMQRLIDAVAGEAGVEASEVKLERAEKITFRDGSLNCPQPNMAYAQVLVAGYWVVFHAGQEEFDMRVTEKGRFSRCTGSTKRPPIRYDDT